MGMRTGGDLRARVVRGNFDGERPEETAKVMKISRNFSHLLLTDEIHNNFNKFNAFNFTIISIYKREIKPSLVHSSHLSFTNDKFYIWTLI